MTELHHQDRARQLTSQRALSAGGGAFIGRIFAGRAREQVFSALEKRITHGRFILRLPDGTERHFGPGTDGPEAEIHILSWRTLQRFLLGGALGFSQAYLDGDWDSPAPEKIIEMAALNRKTFQTNLAGRNWLRAVNHLTHALRPNSRRGSRKNISFHYDLGNDFYRTWLDESMTYSAALYGPGDNSLEAAQKRKYRQLMDMLDLQPGQQLLEIGCGWGGFAEMAAKERGVSVTGITLSQEQLNFAQQRIQNAGLSDKVRFELTDYRDVKGKFDRIASIEMFEAVGERYWPSYFSTLRERLVPGGRAGLQIITIDEALYEDYRRKADFIQTYIFPGGMLPSIPALERQVEKAGLLWRDAKGFATSYADTLAEWRRRFEAAFDAGQMPQGFDDAFRRLWRYYLCYCEGGFRGGSIDVLQLRLDAPS